MRQSPQVAQAQTLLMHLYGLYEQECLTSGAAVDHGTALRIASEMGLEHSNPRLKDTGAFPCSSAANRQACHACHPQL